MSSPSNSSSYSYNTSLLIIAVLLAIVFAFTAVIHLVIRLLTHFYTASDIPLPTHFSANAASAAYSSNANSKSIIDSLPLFNLTSIPCSTSSICTICLSQFAVDDKIRLLPACRHVFHSMCIDAWLKSSPSCPLCRATVEIQNMETTPEPEQDNQQERRQQQQQQQQDEDMNATTEETARVSWLKDYIDRFASSSPFNSMRFSPSPFGSMRFSNWGSRRFDGEVSGGSLELEGDGGDESFRSDNSSSLNSYFASSYKWIMGETDS